MLRPILFVLCSLMIFSCSRDGGSAEVAFDLRGPAPEANGSFAYDVTIVFSNDLHDQVLPTAPKGRGGLARHATLLRWLREEAAARGKGILVCNAGDCFEGTLFYEHDGGATVFRLLESMGYDAVQIGNHDHQFGFQRLYDVIQSAFPLAPPSLTFLGGNLNPSAMTSGPVGSYQGPLPFEPAPVASEVIAAFENGFNDFLTGTIDPALLDPVEAPTHLFQQVRIFTVGGVRVGVFGLDTTEVLYSAVPGEGELFADPTLRAEGCRFYDPLVAPFASAMIQYLEDPDGNPATPDGAQVIMALTHLGLSEDLAVAQAAVSPSGRRLDLIVGGHSHTRLNTAIEVAHLGGATTAVVQAGSKGEFLGRIDLQVETGTGVVRVKNARLIQVDSRIPEDQGALDFIEAARGGVSGVDATYGNPFTRAVVSSPRTLEGGSQAASALGSLAADAALAAANQPPHLLNVDAVVIGNFVFRSDLPEGTVTVADTHAILPLHQVDRVGTNLDVLDVIHLPGGVRDVLNFANFPFPAPNLQMTSVEYFLEVIYSVDDLLALLGQVLGLNIGGASEYLKGLQWSGITFEVDSNGPILQKIDPATIVVGGIPLLSDLGRDYRIGLNAIIARLALPFLQFITQVEEPIGSGILVPFPPYDPATAGTNVVLWEALRDHLDGQGTLSAAAQRVQGDRPRTVAPDLTLNGADVVHQVSGGALPSLLQGTLLNLGGTAAASAIVEARLDATPNDSTDDPDGWTDARTGQSWPVIGSVGVASIPGFGGGAPGAAAFVLPFTMPAGLSPGRYPIHLTIRDVISADAQRPELVTANNSGLDLVVFVTVP